ncbi:MAG: transporter [Acidimicrobiales bacterium]
MRGVFGGVACGLLIFGVAAPARATSLAAKVKEVETRAAGGTAIDATVPTVEGLLPRGIDFPATSTAPGFTYSYNPDLGVFERSKSLGPALLERAETLGKGHFDLGLSFLFADFTTLDGQDLKGFPFKAVVIPASSNAAVVLPATFHKLAVRTSELTLSSSYGITDHWDVNILVPALWTSLSTAVQFSAGAIQSSQNEKIGLGDVQVRTKYRLTEGSGFNVAAGLGLRLPTGKKTDFQGFGDTTVTPFLVGSQIFHGHDFHINLGMETNANDIDLSRVRYGAGVALQPWEPLAFLIDVIGSSGIQSTTLTTKSPAGVDPTDLGPDAQCPTCPTGVQVNRRADGQFDIVTPVGRTDVVDIAVGLKARIAGNVVAFASAIVPLTSDGVRADVVPTGGIEIGF